LRFLRLSFFTGWVKQAGKNQQCATKPKPIVVAGFNPTHLKKYARQNEESSIYVGVEIKTKLIN